MALKLIGHRGARGLFPENTLEGFEKTLQLPVSGLELDIVVSKDEQLVVSHEPWMNHLFCLAPDGSEITEGQEKTHNLFQLNYAEIQQYDCGSKTNIHFPKQQSFKAYKPLLKDVFKIVKDSKNANCELLLEVKSEVECYGIFQPKVDKYSKLIVDFLTEHPYSGMLLIQSFDPNVLNAIYALTQDFRLGLLVENEETIAENLAKLNFIPSHYNLYHNYVTAETVTILQQKQIEVIPWTVNTLEEANRLERLGVKCIITDYPNGF
jgi:glycerophosphoryl diester phosphodiesterase